MRSILFLTAFTILSASVVNAQPAADSATSSTLTRAAGQVLSEEARHKMAAEYSARLGGVSMLVMKDGKVVFEDYRGRNGKEEARELASGTKSFTGVMAIAAVEDGILSSLDEKVADTITEWKDDPRKSQITVRQLLNLTSGLSGGNIGRPPAYADAIAAPATADPGTAFAYGPIPFQVFGELMKRKLAARNQGPLDYLKARVLEPAGVTVTDWKIGEDGNPHLPSGAKLTAVNWAKFGELLRNQGKVGDQQIIKAESFADLTKGTTANPNYGLSVWIKDTDPEHALAQGRPGPKAAKLAALAGALPDDFYMAAGLGKQRLYILPSKGMVVVRQARLIDQGFSDAAFLSLLELGNLPEGADSGVVAGDEGPDRRQRPGAMGNRTPAERAQMMMDRMDANEDGVITQDELPERMQPFFDRMDSDGDGKVTKGEMESLAPPPGGRGQWGAGRPGAEGGDAPAGPPGGVLRRREGGAPPAGEDAGPGNGI